MKKEKTSLRVKRSNPIKILILILITLVICGFLFKDWIATPPARNDNSETKPTIKIGAILPLTGGMASLGIAGNNGAILAIEKLNTNPANKYRYELISDDTATDAKRAAPIYKKMAGIDKVSAIISFDSQAGHVIKPMASQDKILHISSAADNTIADGEYNFINSSDLNDSIAKLLQYFNKMGYKKIALAGVNYTATQKVIKTLKEQIENTDFEIVAEELVSSVERQFQQEILKVVQSNPDVVFLYGFEPVTSIYAKGLKNAGYKGAVSGVYTLSYSEYPELLNEAVYLDYGIGSDEFKQEYLNRFNLEPNAASTVMFDSVGIIANLHEANTNKISDVLKTYTGPNGKFILKDNGLIHMDLVFVKMTNGKPIIVEE